MEDITKVLENGILKIFDKFGNNIPFKKKEIKYYRAKYSSARGDTLTLFLDDVPLINMKKNVYHVEYLCFCGNISNIHLSKYLSKTKMSCNKCRENDDKIAWHKLYFEMRRNGEDRGHRNTSKFTLTYNFNNESDEFKEDYFRRNLTQDEFKTVLPYIYSIDNIPIKGKKVELIIAAPCKNAKKYSQQVLIDGEPHRFKEINLKCSCCGRVFHITRQLKERIQNQNFYCKGCCFTNMSFLVRSYSENLTYQSKEELDFIERCKSLNIEIENGMEIPYFFKNRLHVYNPDFFLPELKIVVEIKDNHIWHKKQVESGKWGAKENAALKYCKEHGYTYSLLFPDDIEPFFNNVQKR